MGKINPLIAIGIPTWGRISLRWAQSFRHLGGPLGSSAIEIVVEGKPIAEARNEIMQTAINSGAEFVFTLSDDVLCPGDTLIKLLQRLRDHPEIDIVTGVYWTKGYPTQPYIWRGMQRGPYHDWKVGEFFPIEFAGCDCLLVRLSDRVKAMGPEWFSTTWLWEPGQAPSLLATEDFYFYTKARQAGIGLWCDASAQCLHEDRQTGQLFGLTTDMPQMGTPPPTLPAGEARADGLVYIADIGAGFDTPYFGDAEHVKVIRFDGNEKARPDYRCDLRSLPVPDQSFDVVHTRHVLEHFGRDEVVKVLTEWTRIQRVGGELRLGVPNLLHALKWIQRMDAGEVPPDQYPWWQLYGAQTDPYDLHKNGYTAKRVRLLLERVGIFENIDVQETDNGLNLVATAIKTRHSEPYALLPGWDAIISQEGQPVEGIISEPAMPEICAPIELVPQKKTRGQSQRPRRPS